MAKHKKRKEKNDLCISNDIEYTEIAMMTKGDLGQYFTTHNELKEKVFGFILNSHSNILEQSMGQGD